MSSSSSLSIKRKSPDQSDANPRKKHRNPTNYVWTPAENRDLMIWTNEFLPQVWSKASVSHANKIKNAIYPNNPLITSENVRHKINNLKAKYRKIRARHDIDTSINERSNSNKDLSQEVRNSIQSEFPDYFLIEKMIKRSEQQEYSNSSLAVVTSNSSPIYLSPTNDLIDDTNNSDPNSTLPSSTAILGSLNQTIATALTDKQALILKNEKLKLEVTRLQLQLQTQDSEQRKREIEFNTWKLETEQMIAQMKLMEQKLKLLLQQHKQQSKGESLLKTDNLMQVVTPSSGSTESQNKSLVESSSLLIETPSKPVEEKTENSKETTSPRETQAKKIEDPKTTKKDQVVDTVITPRSQ